MRWNTGMLVMGLALGMGATVEAKISKDGVSGRTPVMGWNSWNAYRCDVNETRILNAAKELITCGLKDLGYLYVNIDDCWSIPNTRDPETLAIIPDPVKFPNGIKWLADQIHALGLKLGIYGDAGETTCAGFPGSLYFEEIDARTWAEWGIDYLKYDNCNVPSSWPPDPYHNCHPDYNSPQGPNGTCINDPLLAPPGYDWSTSSTAERFMRMSEALDKQNRTILLSLCEWGQAGVAEGWGEEVSISWRLTDDIFPRWPVIKHIANYASFFSHSVAFFAHNDLDMLEIGNGNLTLAEQRTHFSLWAALKSPLLIGTDISALSPATLEILKNHALITFNQDPKIAAPAQPFNWNWEYNDDLPAAYWSGRGQEGVMVLLVNWHEKKRRFGVTWGEVPELVQGKGYKVKNGWTGKDLGCWKGWEGVIEKHDTAVLVVGEECKGGREINRTVRENKVDVRDPDEAPEMLRDSSDGQNEGESHDREEAGHEEKVEGKYEEQCTQTIDTIVSPNTSTFHGTGSAKLVPLLATRPVSNKRISSKKLEYLKEMAKGKSCPGVVGNVKSYRQEDVQVVDTGNAMDAEDSE